MVPLRFEELNRILCLGAHCDDIEIGCGATLLTLLERNPGLEVHWLVFASSPARAEEARACAARFLDGAAAGHIEVMDYRDGFLPWEGARVKERFEALKGEVSPDLIFTHYRHDLHQDHRLLCDLTWNTFRNHVILEYEIPKWDGDVGNPNLYVPIDESIATRKITTIVEAFPSQAGKAWFEEETFRGLMRIRGMESNAPSGYAEAFYARKITL
jgi:LmbE family N-acetylglucosaminyl deacetylase